MRAVARVLTRGHTGLAADALGADLLPGDASDGGFGPPQEDDFAMDFGEKRQSVWSRRPYATCKAAASSSTATRPTRCRRRNSCWTTTLAAASQRSPTTYTTAAPTTVQPLTLRCRHRRHTTSRMTNRSQRSKHNAAGRCTHKRWQEKCLF